MAEIVGSLFGVSPDQLMRQRQATDTANAFKFANLDPMQRAQFSIYQGGAGLGRAVQGLLGGDPELERVSQIKQLSSQFDLTTPDGARQFARALQPFAPQEAMMAAQEADRIEQAGLTRQKAQLDIASTESKQAKQRRLEEEIAKLPEDASPEQLLAVYRRFGNADQQAAAIQRSLDAKANRDLKFSAAAEKAALKAEAETKDQKRMAEDTLDSAVEGISRVNALEKDVNNWTTGAGSYIAWAPFTSAKEFKSSVKTLQSQLDLAVLQAAKAQSRTGATGFGALNSKELAVIQTAISNLDTSLTPSQFKAKLKEVKDYFNKLQNKANKTLGNETQTSPSKTDDPLNLRG